MRKLFFALAAAALLAGCPTTQQSAGIGAGAGAIIGGATTGTVQGAAIGGAIGAGVGALIGRALEPGQCYYRDRNGRRYTAPCP